MQSIKAESRQFEALFFIERAKAQSQENNGGTTVQIQQVGDWSHICTFLDIEKFVFLNMVLW